MMRFGMIVPHLMKMLQRKTDTVLYPAVPVKAPEHFRGALKFDAQTCVGCGMCMRVCPADAIQIVKVEDKKYKAVVRMDKCIYCGQCVDSCPRHSLENTAEFELASEDKSSLEVEI